MKNKKTKKIYNVFIVLALSFILIAVSFLFIPPTSHVQIPDGQVPLASVRKVTAEFYINNTKYNTNTVSFLLCKNIGAGQIYQPNNSRLPSLTSDDINELIYKQPTTPSYLSATQEIKWVKVYYSLYKYRIIGEIVDVKPIIPDKNVTQESVKIENVSSSTQILPLPEQNTEEHIQNKDDVEENIADNTKNILNLSREDILAKMGNSYTSHDILKWENYSQKTKDIHDGLIPTQLLNDPVYLSMNLPSESMCDYTKSLNRDNAHIINPLTSTQTTAVAIGAVYPTSDNELPDSFTICLGNIKLFAFSKSQNDWIVVDTQPYPKGIFIYTLPWTSSTAKKCTNVVYHEDCAEVTLTKEELYGNVLHFWGNRQNIDQEDYLYYACAYEFWMKDGPQNVLTATIAIDAKDANGNNTAQLFSSRGLTVTNQQKTHWGNTIPNSEYDTLRDGAKLQQLFLQ